MRAQVVLLLLPLSSGAIALADEPDPAVLVRKSIALDQAERGKARQYAYREYKVQYVVDGHGKESDRKTETYEVIGLEGSTYRKLVMRNDQPLAAKEQKKEDERLRQETERRRHETPDQRRKRLFSFSYNLAFPYEKLADYYDLRYVGEELAGETPVYVIEGTPRGDVTPQSANDREALNYAVKVWLTKDDCATARMDLEVVGDHSRMQKGSVVRIDLARHEDGVWLPESVAFTFSLRVMKMLNVRGKTTTTYSDYHKFQVDSRMVDETPH